MEEVGVAFCMLLVVFFIFALGAKCSPYITCKGNINNTAEYLHTRMCDANEWKDCQPWVREEPTSKERYMNLAKDVCK
jgi:hypothetical protein